MRRPKVGALFAGYGGLDMAVQEVFGAELAWYAEFDPVASLILAHHFPGVPNYGDVTTIKWTPDCPACSTPTVVEWDDDGEPAYRCEPCARLWDVAIRHDDPMADRIPEPVEIVTGGSPCQDLSGAGRRAGMTEGTRSNLWVAMREAIARLRPARVVWENVRGAFTAEAASAVEHCPGCMGDPGHGGPPLLALGRVLGDLSDLRYDAVWHGLLAADPAVGAPHPRFRVFVSAQDPDQSTRSERWVTAPRQTQGGPRPDAGRRGGAPAQRLMPTPTTQDAKNNGSASQMERNTLPLNALVTLFPTPMTDPASGNGHARDLATEVRTLLPTPAVNDMGEGKTVDRWDEWTADMQARHGNGNGHGKSLAIEAQRLLPTPVVTDSNGARNATSGRKAGSEHHGGTTLGDVAYAGRWGDYADAVARWESALGRPAPSPTEPAPKGGVRLAAPFVEWMMGLPEGWVTDPAIWTSLTDKRTRETLTGARLASASRKAMLKALGNGVVRQQAVHALRVACTWEQVAA